MAAMDWGLSSPGMFNNTLAQALQPKPWLISPLLNNQTVAGANQSLLNSNTLHQAINSFSHPLMTTTPNTTASPQAGLNMNQLLMQNSPLLQQAPTQPPTQAPAKPNPLVNSLQLQQAINILSEQAQMNQGNKLPFLALSSLIASQNSTMNNQLVNRRPVHGFSFPNANQPYLAESTDNTTDSGSKGSDESGSDGGDAHGQAGSVSDKGERRSKSWKIMLTAEQAVVIYKERPTGSSRGTGASVAVGKKFGVSAKTIRDIWNRETWVKATRDHWTSEEEEHYERAHKTEDSPSGVEPGSVASLIEGAAAQGDSVGQKRSRGRPKGVKDSRPRKCRHPTSA